MLDFTVLAPWWRQPWTFALWIATAVTAAYMAHRRRLARAVEMERLRTRLASDLHDDLGAGLTEIALLTETAAARPSPKTDLDRIGQRARALRESMADIVWSVDPSRDRLSELPRHMRHTALSLLESDDREVVFEAPDTGDAPLQPAFRRHVFLLFKEACRT